ncbi:MAG TPA: hypothetical protein VFY40_19415 [Blastocatellia bacterium]|nr:hypothetical protein [Blastocatellia bacterium]
MSKSNLCASQASPRKPRLSPSIIPTLRKVPQSPTSIGGVATTFGKDLLEKENDSLALAGRGAVANTTALPRPGNLGRSGITFQ